MKDRFKLFGRGLFNIALFFVVPLYLAALIPNFVINGSNLVKDICLLVIELLLFLIISIFNLKLLKEDFKNFKTNYRKYLNEGFKYYFLGLALMIISNIIIITLNGGSIANNENANREILNLYPIYAVLSVALLGPIVEEIVFRGGFKKCFKNIIVYSLFTGIIFGSAHVFNSITSYWDLLFIVPYSLLGIAFGYACFKTNNIFTSISLHVFHNCLSLLIIILGSL